MAQVYKGTDAYVAHMDEVGVAVVDLAVETRDTARRLLAARRITGEHRIDLRLGFQTDAFVDLTGPAAVALERGHVDRAGKYVPGVNVLGDAAGL